MTITITKQAIDVKREAEDWNKNKVREMEEEENLKKIYAY